MQPAAVEFVGDSLENAGQRVDGSDGQRDDDARLQLDGDYRLRLCADLEKRGSRFRIGRGSAGRVNRRGPVSQLASTQVEGWDRVSNRLTDGGSSWTIFRTA
jgi:hypothetical protein